MSKKDLKKEKEEKVEETKEKAVEEETIVEETEEAKEDEVAKESETEKLKNDLNALNDKYLRMLAEFDNYKRRTQKEKEGTYELAVSNTVESMIPVLDTLEIAMKNETGDVENFRKGIELVIKKFNDTLAKMGVVPIDAVNKPFDPQFHNAVMNTEEGEGESGTVVEELQKGYMINDRIIRHSMVKVKA